MFIYFGQSANRNVHFLCSLVRLFTLIALICWEKKNTFKNIIQYSYHMCELYRRMDSRVPDPWRFDKGSEPQSRITELRNRTRLFSPVTFKMPKKCFFSRVFFLLITVLIPKGTFSSVFKVNKLFKSYKRVEIKVFLIFLLIDGRIRIRTRNTEE